MKSKVLYFANYWAREQTSAACERVFALVKALHSGGYNLDFICAGKKPRKTEGIQLLTMIKSLSIDPNDFDAVQKYFKELKDSVEVGFFDTFVAEEFYGHHFNKAYPRALTVVDTQDLHSLRKIREAKYLELLAKDPTLGGDCLLEILRTKPTMDDPLHAREMAAIFRSDLTLVTSDYEQNFLQSTYGLTNLDKSQFSYNQNYFDEKEEGYRRAFLDGDRPPAERRFGFDRRKHFVFVGNYQHQPNVQAVEVLIQHIWPKIRAELPDAELHIYGANFPKKFENIEKDGIKKKNLMPSMASLVHYRVLLAPLFFGAGIKGKVTDSWCHFLPVVTTPVGSEGLYFEAVDDDHSVKRVFPDGKSDRFIKPEKEILRVTNHKLIDFYQYHSQKSIQESDLTFGGLYKSLSELTRL